MTWRNGVFWPDPEGDVSYRHAHTGAKVGGCPRQRAAGQPSGFRSRGTHDPATEPNLEAGAGLAPIEALDVRCRVPRRRTDRTSDHEVGDEAQGAPKNYAPEYVGEVVNAQKDAAQTDQESAQRGQGHDSHTRRQQASRRREHQKDDDRHQHASGGSMPRWEGRTGFEGQRVRPLRPWPIQNVL
jgi:hypothetical protein